MKADCSFQRDETVLIITQSVCLGHADSHELRVKTINVTFICPADDPLCQLLKMCICENKCISNRFHVNTISPITGRALNRVLMEGQDLGQRWQKNLSVSGRIKGKK